MKKYHPILVALHWLLVAIILVALYMGTDIASWSNDLDLKIQRIDIHMKAGFIILALMIIRLLIRLFSKKPPHADIGNKTINFIGVWAHYGLYILVFAIIGSGIATSLIANIPDIILSDGYLPDSVSELPSRIAHGILTKLLMLLILGHILAALYHQFVRKDKLFSRMWFGNRK